MPFNIDDWFYWIIEENGDLGRFYDENEAVSLYYLTAVAGLAFKKAPKFASPLLFACWELTGIIFLSETAPSPLEGLLIY